MVAPPELKEIHPLGKSPLLSVQAEGAPEPLVLAESGLIAEYLIEHFGPSLAPSQYQNGKEGQVQGETEEWLRYRYFMHYGEGSLMPFLVILLVLRSMIPPSTKRSCERGLTSPSYKRKIAFLHQAHSECNHREHRINVPQAKSREQLQLPRKPSQVGA